MLEKLTQLIPVIHRIVIAFLDFFLAQVIRYLSHGFGIIVKILSHRRFDCRVQLTDFQNVKQQHRRIRHRRTAALGNQRWVSHRLLIQCIHQNFNHVGTILIQRVVPAGCKICRGPVIIDRHAAADIQIPHRGAFLDQPRVNARRLGHRIADVPDVGNLRTEMIMQQFQTVQFIDRLKLIDHLQHLHRV